MKNFYFDTEFEGLFTGAGLISIGLTDSSAEHTFYEELSDTYQIERCSDFCKKVVLPLLNKNNTKTLKEVQDCLYQWLCAFNEHLILISDSERDIEQIRFLFPHGLPQHCSFKVLGLYEKYKRRVLNFNGRIYKQHNLRHHHALDDALANRIIFEN